LITAPEVAFWIIAVVMVATAMGVVLHRNPVRSALLLVLNFCGLAALYFTLNAQLLAVLQILVYAGAIMVLFLFVIMMLNLGGELTLEDHLVGQRSVGVILGVCLLGGLGATLWWFVTQGTQAGQLGGPTPLPEVDQVQVIGIALFTRYLYPFELTSVLLLIGLVGAMVLARAHLRPERPASAIEEGGE